MMLEVVMVGLLILVDFVDKVGHLLVIDARHKIIIKWAF